MKKRKTALFLGALVASFLFFEISAEAAYRLDRDWLREELAAAGYNIIGETDYYGVPCLKIELPMQTAIYQICREVPLLNAHYLEAREAIAVINGLNMFYPRSRQGRPFDTVRETILIPLDTTIQPKAFPEHEQKFSNFEKMIFVDRAKQLLAYYECGNLVACFPVSTGRGGKETPAMEGWIGIRDKNHVSSIYDVPMPYSLLLIPPYFLHAGVMPGQPDSAGCIRMFTEHAQWIFHRVGKTRTRFRIR